MTHQELQAQVALVNKMQGVVFRDIIEAVHSQIVQKSNIATVWGELELEEKTVRRFSVGTGVQVFIDSINLYAYSTNDALLILWYLESLPKQS